MDDIAESQKPDRVALTVDIVAAYVSRNSVQAGDLPALVSGIYAKLAALDTPAGPEVRSEKAAPAQIRRSITPNALISFIDGRPYKTLKRHLTAYGLDPDAYRKRFGLPGDYPMVAPGYAEHRAAIARDAGFGQLRQSTGRAGAAAPRPVVRPGETG